VTKIAKIRLEKWIFTIFATYKRYKYQLVMLRRKIDKIISDFYNNEKKALLIIGARQIGKSFSIREYGKKHFKRYVEINFIKTPNATSIFKSYTDSNDILLRLSAFSDEPLIKGDTFIFFDEVQACPEVVTAIKFLVEDGSYRYALSGSMLGVELKDLRSAPVGYMDIENMYPLDFEEFLMAIGVNDDVISSVRNAWENRIPVDSFIHDRLINAFRLYLVVGGMPDVVNRYIESNDLNQVMNVQNEILKLYKVDATQYDKEEKLNINEVFDIIPSELNSKNKRFILKNLNEKSKFRKYEDSFLWLKNAGVALPVYNAEEPKTPLVLARTRSLFKLFQNDVGLLAAQYADGIQLKIISGDDDINFGAIYENVVAQELTAHGFGQLYYYNNKKQGELDFVIEHNDRVLPIEVKSGKDYKRHRALNNIMSMDEYDINDAIVLSNENLSTEGNILYAPIYMTMFITKKRNQSPLIYKFDLDGLK
jgi:predicted AAA+ superfamily ATPase